MLIIINLYQQEEDQILREELDKSKQRIREFHEKQQRAFRSPATSHVHGHPHPNPHAAHSNEHANIQVR